jgi:hypothetical protein
MKCHYCRTRTCSLWQWLISSPCDACKEEILKEQEEDLADMDYEDFDPRPAWSYNMVTKTEVKKPRRWLLLRGGSKFFRF